MLYYLTEGVIRNFDVNGAILDDLKLFLVELDGLVKGYGALGFDVPEWLTGKQREVKAALELRLRNEKERELKLLKARRETLKTPDEKRKGVEERIAELEKELA